MGAEVTKMSVTKYRPSFAVDEIQIYRLFEQKMVNYPKNTALLPAEMRKTQRTPMSYEELSKLSSKCATVLVDFINVPNKEDTIIIVCAEPNPTMIVILLGIWKAGAAYLVIDVTNIDANISRILNETNPALIIYEESVSERFDHVGKIQKLSISNLMYAVNRLRLENLEQGTLLSQNNFDSLACIMYTCSNRSVPKGVKITHRGIWNRLVEEWKILPYNAKDKYAVFQTSPSCVESISELWSPLIHGLTLLMLPLEIRYQTERLVGILQEYQVTRVHIVPNVLASIIGFSYYRQDVDQERLLHRVKYWLCSGELLTPRLLKLFYEYFDGKTTKLFNLYGCTETTGAVSYFACNANSDQIPEFVPIGAEPSENVKFYIVDENFNLLPEGVKGELCISGATLAKGYTNPELKQIRTNPFSNLEGHKKIFLTGDYCMKEGDLYIFLGRKEEDAEISGNVLNVAQVENFLSEISLVAKAVVVTYRISKDESKLLAFIKLLPNSPIETKKEIETMIGKELKLKPEIILIENIPNTVSGKVDRASLIKCYNDVDAKKNRSNVEMDLTDFDENDRFIGKDLFEVVFAVMRGRDIPLPLNLEMNFFDIGGTSLGAVELVLYLNQKGYSITIDDFINCQNLGETVERMRQLFHSPVLGNQSENNHQKVFEAIPFSQGNQLDIIRFIRKIVYLKSIELEKYMEPEKFITEFGTYLNKAWKDLENLSFAVKDLTNSSLIGFSLNLKNSYFPEVEMSPSVATVFQFFEFLLSSLRTQYFVRSNHQIMLSFLLGTSDVLTPQMNLSCIQFIEMEKVKIALANKFSNILCINTNLLMQKISSEIFLYKTLRRFPINTYQTDDRTKPFQDAPDDVEAMVQWRILPEQILNV